MSMEQQYISGLGKESILPPELKRWNWGAFLLNWIWGIGNSTFIALFMFVPLLNVIMPFILGAKGNKWAWQNRTWRDIDHFKSTQKKWAIWGLTFLVIWVVFILVLLFPLVGLMKNNDAYKTSFMIVQSDPEIQEIIGTPIESGFFVSGNIQTSGPDGQATVQYTIKGPKGEGVTNVFAYKNMGKWVIQELVVYFEETDRRIELIMPKE